MVFIDSFINVYFNRQEDTHIEHLLGYQLSVIIEIKFNEPSEPRRIAQTEKHTNIASYKVNPFVCLCFMVKEPFKGGFREGVKRKNH